MSKTSKILIGAIIITMLIVGVGYAAITQVNLSVIGSATADPSSDNFKVKFTGTTNVSDSTKVTAKTADDLTATLSVTGLEKVGDSVTATYEIENSSLADIKANLTANVTQNTDSTKFTVTPTLTKSTIAPNEKTELTIRVDLIAISITGENNSTITVQVDAEPVQ